MIKLSGGECGELWIDPDNGMIVEKWKVVEGEHTSRLHIKEKSFIVSEAPEEVARKVLEYKLAMIQYQVYLANAQENDDWSQTASIRQLLGKLAGIEDTGGNIE